MNISTMKLREAHKNGENLKSSFCSILWDSEADHIVTASSADNSICIHDAVSPSNPPKFLDNHREGVTVLALSPDSTCLASGSLDHSVKPYKFPEDSRSRTRINLAVVEILRPTSLHSNCPFVLLRSITMDGFWLLLVMMRASNLWIHSLERFIEFSKDMKDLSLAWLLILRMITSLHLIRLGPLFTVKNILAWCPDGKMLAVPGLKDDVVMYDRDTAERLFSIQAIATLFAMRYSHGQPLRYRALRAIDNYAMEHDGYSRVEIDFHDTSRGPHVPAINDYFGFTMASLSENGCAFAIPCKGEKNMSTLMYRPFSTWDNNSERYILSLEGPVVTAAGFKDELKIVMHISPSLPSD